MELSFLQFNIEVVLPEMGEHCANVAYVLLKG